MSKPGVRITANERLRRSLKDRARSYAETIICNRYLQEFREARTIEAFADPDASSSTVTSRAKRAVCAQHGDEYRVALREQYVDLLDEHGYQKATTRERSRPW